MTYLANRDYNIEVRRGNVSGHRMVLIEGHDEALDTTRTTVHPTGTTNNIDQSGLFSSAITVDVASTDTNDSSSGSGVRTVSIIGLDSAGASQSETVTMNGQTEVTTSNTWSAICNILSITWGNTTYNEGTVWVGNGSFTSGVPATKYFAMGIQQNNGLTAYYIVGADKTLYLTDITLMVSTSNKDADFFLERSANGVNWITLAVFGMEPGNHQDLIRAIPGIAAGSHVRIEAKSSGANTDASVILEGEMIDD